ncbi:hypothetical protein NDU88_000771 [Pleurodeles waltl]|uniref:Uncharacterized protein n=1 Tax=Pleurodeles waltl TaxID=8319 RepID=A0AAV7P534_PLEWA|nr:hypothetical protein NDU88_000771 [Pleurodeles waltl]
MPKDPCTGASQFFVAGELDQAMQKGMQANNQRKSEPPGALGRENMTEGEDSCNKIDHHRDEEGNSRFENLEVGFETEVHFIAMNSVDHSPEGHHHQDYQCKKDQSWYKAADETFKEPVVEIESDNVAHRSPVSRASCCLQVHPV